MRNEDLVVKQQLSLQEKIAFSKKMIRQFYETLNGQVYISFSGGKDSTVLLDIVRQEYPDVEAVFSHTGLQFPMIREFVKTVENVTWIKPKMTFLQVIEKHGYPVISKEQATYIREYRTTKSEYLKKVRWNGKLDKKGVRRFKISEKWKFLVNAPFKISEQCCDELKKKPFKIFEKKSGLRPFLGTMAVDSRLRWKNYLETGCNDFHRAKGPVSKPLGFWREEDIWQYIKSKKLPYCKIYDCGAKRTGCIFCLFGIHLEEESRFALLKKIEPKLYRYCMDTLGIKKVLEYIGYNYNQEKLLSIGRN